ncbi:unnamed protein product, partial [Symbiodinium sp. KB8]
PLPAALGQEEWGRLSSAAGLDALAPVYRAAATAAMPRVVTQALRREARAMGLAAPLAPWPQDPRAEAGRGAAAELAAVAPWARAGAAIRAGADDGGGRSRRGSVALEAAWPAERTGLVVAQEDAAWRPVHDAADLTWTAAWKAGGSFRRWIEGERLLRQRSMAELRALPAPKGPVGALPAAARLIGAASEATLGDGAAADFAAMASAGAPAPSPAGVPRPWAGSQTAQSLLPPGAAEGAGEIHEAVVAAASAAREAVSVRRNAEQQLLGAESADSEAALAILAGGAPAGGAAHRALTASISGQRVKGGRRAGPARTGPLASVLPPLPPDMQGMNEAAWRLELRAAAEARRPGTVTDAALATSAHARALGAGGAVRVAVQLAEAREKTLALEGRAETEALPWATEQGFEGEAASLALAGPAGAASGSKPRSLKLPAAAEGPLWEALRAARRLGPGVEPGAESSTLAFALALVRSGAVDAGDVAATASGGAHARGRAAGAAGGRLGAARGNAGQAIRRELRFLRPVPTVKAALRAVGGGDPDALAAAVLARGTDGLEPRAAAAVIAARAAEATAL